MATNATPRPAKVRAAKPRPAAFTMLDELLRSLGVPARRVRLDPPPGTATVRDVIRIHDREGRLFELVDGTLVEKAMSVDAAFVAVTLIQLLGFYQQTAGNLGMVLGSDGFLRLSARYVRAPDVSFTNWDRLPNRKVPREPIPTLAPDLAVEVLSPSNTRREMTRKRKEYFESGVRLVWVIDPKARTVQVYTPPGDVTDLGPADTLTGGDVLPGFAVPVADLFANLADEPPARKPRKKKK
jgi:Uma2 family endonuclease